MTAPPRSVRVCQHSLTAQVGISSQPAATLLPDEDRHNPGLLKLHQKCCKLFMAQARVLVGSLPRYLSTRNLRFL